ncbi:two-component system sensor histidine kinase CreC [Litoribacillus peritrichatus]|uniref:histidine kinase n=1 Tax=Litoribacillus peritrichatus TaxID=718191 RepID=A0ABP7MTX3_9GAMM
MSLNLRIFFAYFLIVGMASYLLLNVFMSELRPGVRQSTEDTLVDMSNVLAELVADELLSGQIQQQNFSQSIDRFLERSYRAKIFSVDKPTSAIRIYITDVKGIVQYDSDQVAVGQDYSRWNDVYLTLRGQYGARSTKLDPTDELSTVMHVAAPIKNGNEIVGVLTVAKPNHSVQPFIDLAKDKMKQRGLWLLVLSLLLGGALSFWLTRSIRKLARYSDQVASGQRATVPNVRESELAKLAQSIDNMRRQLEGKDYVEKYVHALTHELKSPVSVIRGAAEIVQPNMPAADLTRFMSNIQQEAERIDEVINRLLELASVENKTELENIETIALGPLMQSLLESKQILMKGKALALCSKLPEDIVVSGDRFLLAQALDNLLQNAIEFSPESGTVHVAVSQKGDVVSITITDQGPGIPEYATDKIFDRFYSLARPGTQKKSSGLGLCFVKQIAELHQGDVQLVNDSKGGAVATFRIP